MMFSASQGRSGAAPDTPGKVRVLVVDDSPLMRQMLTRILESDPAIEVVGQAADAYQAR